MVASPGNETVGSGANVSSIQSRSKSSQGETGNATRHNVTNPDDASATEG